MGDFYQLPQEVKFCTKCTISNQRPCSVVETSHKLNQKKQTIEFNHEGVCSACLYHEEFKKRKIDWAERERELIALCERHRSKRRALRLYYPWQWGQG